MNSAAEQTTDGTARTWAMAAHLSALSLYLGMIFTNLLFPYLIWRWQRKRSDFAGEHAREALNYQITFTVAVLAALVVALFLPWAWLLVIAAGTANIVFIGQAADRAKSGLPYRYPGSWSWIR